MLLTLQHHVVLGAFQVEGLGHGGLPSNAHFHAAERLRNEGILLDLREGAWRKVALALEGPGDEPRPALAPQAEGILQVAGPSHPPV